MTRGTTTRLMESKLQLALVELKKYKDLCEELQGEQSDNEREVLQTLQINAKLKSEMVELHSQLITTCEERDKLQRIVDSFDQCSNEFDTTIKHNAELKRRLSEAQDTIDRMGDASRGLRTAETNVLFEQLVGSTRLHSASSVSSNVNSDIVTIDLTCDNSAITSPQVRLVNCSRKKLRKYIRINKMIKKTQNLIKNNKNSFSKHYKSFKHCKQLKERLSHHFKVADSIKSNYEAEIQLLQSEIIHLQGSLDSITSKYDISRKEMGDYILAMNDLVDLCSENERMFNSIVNNPTPDCDPSGRSESVPSHEPVHSVETFDSPASTSLAAPNAKILLKDNLSNYSLLNDNDQIIMYCDEIGKNMGRILQHRLHKRITNYCMPDASYCEILEKVITSKHSSSTTIIILVGRRGNAHVGKMKMYFDYLNKLNVKKIVLFAFPYCNGLPQTENNIRYKYNTRLHTMTLYNEKFDFIDSNVLISKNYFMTEDNYYLCNFFKRQIVDSLSYCIFNCNRFLGNYTASIEQFSDVSSVNAQELDISPSHLN